MGLESKENLSVESFNAEDIVLNVSLSSNAMEAYIRLEGNMNEKVPAESELLNILSSKGVTYGIKSDVLKNLSCNPVFYEDICIAEGKPPVNGKNGSLNFLFDKDRKNIPTILEDGRVDFRELNAIENVDAGQKLCELIPPVPAQDGMNVKGEIVKGLSGKSAVLPRGKNVKISEDGQYLESAISGQVSYDDGQINVFACYEVKDDVDNSVGNICFIGNVVIRGNVLSGFSIEAKGNVEVWGVVEGAAIKAGGDIVLRKGMLGHGKGLLQSDGSIITKYIENGTAEAKKDIKAEAIMHSNIKCGNILELTGKKGLLVGGSCKVGREVRAKVIGSHMATITELETGLDPTVRERSKVVKEEIIAIENDLKKTDQAIGILTKIDQAGSLTEDKREMMVKSVRTKIHLSSRLKDLRNEEIELDFRLQQDLPGKVKVSNCIYPGTRVSIGTCMMYVKETLSHCTLYRDGADVRVGPL